MRVKLLRGVCIRGAGYSTGDVVEMDSATGTYLVRRGVGVEADDGRRTMDEVDGAEYGAMDGHGRTRTEEVETATVQAAEQATGRRQRRKI